MAINVSGSSSGAWTLALTFARHGRAFHQFDVGQGTHIGATIKCRCYSEDSPKRPAAMKKLNIGERAQRAAHPGSSIRSARSEEHGGCAKRRDRSPNPPLGFAAVPSRLKKRAVTY